MKIGRRYIPLVAALAIAIIGIVAGFPFIGPQNGPIIGTGSASQNCTTLTASQAQALPGNYINAQFAILFDCSTYGFEGSTWFANTCATIPNCPQTPAFTIGTTGMYTPQVTPNGYSKIFFYPRVNTYPFPGPFNGKSCTSIPFAVQIFGPLTPTFPLSVQANEYNYCAEVTFVPANTGLQPFTVTWTTPP